MSLLKGAAGQHQAGEFVPLLRAGAAVGARAFSQAEVAGRSGELTCYVIQEAAAARPIPEAVASRIPARCDSETF